MKNKPVRPPHKRSAQPREAVTPQPDQNFKQSRDIREDRGERQIKLGGEPRTSR